jgi:serine/threonine-protein kinase
VAAVTESPESFDRLRDLFARLSESPPAEREREIARLAGDSAALASELREMLAAAERAETALDGAVLRLIEGAEAMPAVPGFLIRRRIGRGGSATVYLAAQERPDFQREVALKVVDRVFDADSRRRVREEQRILARLEHPGIARLYDAGLTATGQPYLAMELVEGETLLEHCRARRLSIRQRLELFQTVLDAVRFAHERGVVHRDLKPANILISARGEAKLLDFGIAKLVEGPSDEETQTGRRAMTPRYASPEQLRGDRIGSASDIYSLGVVLYELLADASPYRLESGRVETLEEAIREQDPEPPSAALARTTETAPGGDRGELARRRRALQGDLDAILLKTLRKEPQARYATVSALAEDLGRFLADQPVGARRGSWRYRAGKLARRHRGVVGTGALALALLLALAAIPRLRALWLGEPAAGPPAEFARFRDTRPADPETRSLLATGGDLLARRNEIKAREVFRQATVRSPREVLAWDGLARAAGAVEEYASAAEAASRAGELASQLAADEAELVRTRALAADRKWDAAIPALEALFGRLPGRVDVGLDLVGALTASGRSDEAETALGRVRQLRSGGATEESDPRIDVAEAEIALRLSEFQRAAAAAARARDRAAATGGVAIGLRAERLHAEAITRLDRRDEARRDLESIVTRAEAAGLDGMIAAARLDIGVVLMRTGANDETQAVLEQALAGLRAAGNRAGEVIALVNLGLVAGKRGAFTEAMAFSDQALSTAREVDDRWSEGYVLSQRLVLLNWADDEEGVMAIAESTLAALRDSGNRLPLLSTLANLALSRIEHLQLDQAAAYIDEATLLGRRLGSQSASGKVDRARGYLQQTQGDLDLARQSYNAGLERAQRSGAPLEIASFHFQLAGLELDADHLEAVAKHAEESVAGFRGAGNPRLADDAEPFLAWVEAKRGDAEAARARLATLETSRLAGSGASEFGLRSGEARVCEVLGDWRRAERLRRQTIAMAGEWKSAGLVAQERLGLARALAAMGRHAELVSLADELMPEAERHGLRGVEKELRSLLAADAKKQRVR